MDKKRLSNLIDNTLKSSKSLNDKIALLRYINKKSNSLTNAVNISLKKK